MNPVEYAEQNLGVHEVYAEATALTKSLDELMTALDKAIDERRTYDEQISNYEMDLLIAERGQNADMSEAAFARHLKEVIHTDQTLKRVKQDRNAKAGEVSGLELDIEYHKYKIKVAVARMEQLNGLLQFYAAAKLSETARSAQAAASGGEANETNATGEQS